MSNAETAVAYACTSSIMYGTRHGYPTEPGELGSAALCAGGILAELSWRYSCKANQSALERAPVPISGLNQSVMHRMPAGKSLDGSGHSEGVSPLPKALTDVLAKESGEVAVFTVSDGCRFAHRQGQATMAFDPTAQSRYPFVGSGVRKVLRGGRGLKYECPAGERGSGVAPTARKCLLPERLHNFFSPIARAGSRYPFGRIRPPDAGGSPAHQSRTRSQAARTLICGEFSEEWRPASPRRC